MRLLSDNHVCMSVVCIFLHFCSCTHACHDGYHGRAAFTSPTHDGFDVQITGLTRLAELDLQRNMLSELPPGFEAFGRLRRLLLRDNDFVRVPPVLTQNANIAVMARRAARGPPGALKLVGLAAEAVPLAWLSHVDLRDNPQPSSRRFFKEGTRRDFAADVETLQKAGCDVAASGVPVWPRVSPMEAALDMFQSIQMAPA